MQGADVIFLYGEQFDRYRKGIIEIMNAIENAKRIAGNVVVNAAMNYITNGNVERKIDDLFNIALKLARKFL